MALNLYNIESIISGVDIVLELIFGLVTLLLAFQAKKVYDIIKKKSAKQFSMSFFLISASYFIEALFNFLIISEYNESVCQIVNIRSILLFNTLGLYLHMLFMILGYSLLVYMTLKVEKKKVLWLLVLVNLIVLIFSRNKLFFFFALSSIYLLFIAMHFIQNYAQKKNAKSLVIAISFIFLFVGKVHFIFNTNHIIFYPLAHMLELFAYLLILSNYYFLKKDEQKKRPA